MASLRRSTEPTLLFISPGRQFSSIMFWHLGLKDHLLPHVIDLFARMVEGGSTDYGPAHTICPGEGSKNCRPHDAQEDLPYRTAHVSSVLVVWKGIYLEKGGGEKSSPHPCRSSPGRIMLPTTSHSRILRMETRGFLLQGTVGSLLRIT